MQEGDEKTRRRRSTTSMTGDVLALIGEQERIDGEQDPGRGYGLLADLAHSDDDD